MKKLWIVALVMFTMISCFPKQPNLVGQRLSEYEVEYRAMQGPTLSASTSTIFGEVPEGCEYVGNEGNVATCIAPAIYVFITDGRMSANIHRDFIPVSAPVVVE